MKIGFLNESDPEDFFDFMLQRKLTCCHMACHVEKYLFSLLFIGGLSGELRVGIKKDVHHHVARHTFSTTVLHENEVDIKTVSRFIGHFSVKSTEVYAKVTKELLENVAKKIDVLVNPINYIS